jgi:hypothetical protein
MRDEGYTSAYPYGVQRYDDRFKGMAGEALTASVLDVYIPIKPIKPANDDPIDRRR